MKSVVQYHITVVCALVILLVSSPISGQIWIDDFDGSNSVPFTIDLECGGAPDFAYFGVACLSGGGCGLEISPAFSGVYSNISGNFLGAFNTNSTAIPVCNDNSDQETAQWTGIDISSCSSPNKAFLCFKVASVAADLPSCST